MRKLIPVIVPLLLTITIACLLAILADLDQMKPGFDTKQNEKNDKVRLTDRNLVDEMLKIPLELTIRHVQVKPELLVIDLSVEKEGTLAASIYQDIFAINQYAFEHTLNMKKVLIRILSDITSNEKMLVSMQSEKLSWQTMMNGSIEKKEIRSGEIFNAFQGIRYTHEWSKYFK